MMKGVIFVYRGYGDGERIGDGWKGSDRIGGEGAGRDVKGR